MTFDFKLFKKGLYGIFDQIFSSILIFGINIYFAQKAYFNEIGILALVFASFGFAQVLQQALLEKPFLIKKNIFSLKIIAQRLALIFTLLLISIFSIFVSETNSSSQETFSDYFILPWICLGVVHLLFILTRIYYYAINKQNVAFYMSSISTILIFTILLYGQNFIGKRLSIIMFVIVAVKFVIILYFISSIESLDDNSTIEDSNVLQYILLILISLSYFLRSRLVVFYLANFAYILAGLYEILRNIIELVVMPFRPISEILLNHFSINRTSISILPKEFIFIFSLVGVLFSGIFYLSLDTIFNILNITNLISFEIKAYLSAIVFISIFLVPIDASLLAYKNFSKLLTTKIFPVIFLAISLFYSEYIYEIKNLLNLITIAYLIELVLSLVIFLLNFFKSTVKFNKI